MNDSQRSTPQPVNLTLHQASRTLSIEFDDGKQFDLSCEFLRVWTPSAEARGHGPGQEVLQVGKREVTIDRIDPVGHYAVRLVFSDGHDTGLYSWDTLYEFGLHRDELWSAYLDKLASNGASRTMSRTSSRSSNATNCSCSSTTSTAACASIPVWMD